LIIFNENITLYNASEEDKFMQKSEENRTEIIKKIVNEGLNDFS